MVSRADGKRIPIKFYAEPFCFFHTINAYEEDGHIICDITCYKDGDVVDLLYRKNIINYRAGFNEDNAPPEFEKWREVVQAQPRRYVLPIQVDPLQLKVQILFQIAPLIVVVIIMILYFVVGFERQ